MAMLADLVELVIGVDTHNDTHTAAVVQAVSGAVVGQVTVPATPAGYRQLLRLADRVGAENPVHDVDLRPRIGGGGPRGSSSWRSDSST